MASQQPETDLNEIWKRWRELRNLLVHRNVPLDDDLRADLFELQNRVRTSLFAEPGVSANGLTPDDPRIVFVLDVLAALSVSEPDDPAHPWARGNVLAEVGRHLEAAEEFMVALTRFETEYERGTGQTGDEDEWAQSALYHAVKHLALGGQVLAAGALLPRLDPDDQAELRSLIDDVQLPAAAG